jgi:hypothetical protein
MPTQVIITNTYPDRSNTETVTVPDPESLSPEDLEDWWEEEVFPHTGDGRGSNDYAVYTATVTESDVPGLVGKWNEWDG